jgi:hypothetical protein
MGEAVFKNGGRKAAKPQTRTEQYDVVCSRTARDATDLRDAEGVLTIDFVDDVASEVTFDPDDETIPNAILPVRSMIRAGASITLRTDDGHLWAFDETSEGYEDDPMPDDSEDDDSEDDSDE